MAQITEAENFVIERDLSLENAVSISRQWGVLLDDYRYLLDKFMADCECHIQFDNIFFLRGMEQRYETLKKMANDNEYLSAFSNDENDWATLNSLWHKKSTKSSDMSAQQNCIRRITVINDDAETGQNTQMSNESDATASHISRRLIKRQSEKTGTGLTEDGEGVGSDPEPAIVLPSKVYKCELKECDFTTMSQAKYQAHVRYHQGLSGGSQVKAGTVLHICHHCGKEFSAEDELKNHIQNSHVDVKVWSCEVPGCKYTTKFRSCFRDHMIRHTGKKNFHCDWEGCEKDFRTRRDLMAHVNFHHRCIRRFKCQHPGCNNSFKDSNRLKHHQYIHTGERPYKCKFGDCDASFKQIPHLKKHEKIHLNKQADEPDETEYVLEEGAVWQFAEDA